MRASMMCCFNAATAGSAWRTKEVATRPQRQGKASMRPRRVPRGDLLQCGHGGFAVENSPRRRYRPGTPGASMRPRRVRRGERGGALMPNELRFQLQCGHGGFAVENLSVRIEDDPEEHGFNAAT